MRHRCAPASIHQDRAPPQPPISRGYGHVSGAAGPGLDRAGGLRDDPGVDVNQYKPAWLLLREAAGRDARVRDAALGELLRRVSRKTMPAGTLRTVVDRALRVQADLKTPWIPGWGDIVELAHAQGNTSPEQWNLYMKQAPQIELRVRPKIRHGGPLPIARDYSARVGKNGAVFVKRKGTPATVDGRTCDDYIGRGMELAYLCTSPVTSPSIIQATDSGLANLKVGRHTLHWTLDQWVYDRAPRDFADTMPAIDFGRHEFDTSFEVVAGPTVALLVRPELQGQIAQSLAVRLQSESQDKVGGGIAVQSSPVPVAFDIFLKDGEKDWNAGTLAAAASSKQTWCGLGAKAPGLGGICDIVLRTSREAAERTIDLTEVWDGEIVIRNVRVR